MLHGEEGLRQGLLVGNMLLAILYGLITFFVILCHLYD
jgi:hypothetical protein